MTRGEIEVGLYRATGHSKLGSHRRSFTTRYPYVVLFIDLMKRCTDRGVVDLTDASEIFVVLFIGETPMFNRFNRKKLR
jgi:hypothetical protein